MSGIAAVSGQMSSVASASIAAPGAAAAGAAGGTAGSQALGQSGSASAAGTAGPDAAAAGGPSAGNVMSSTSVQTSSLIGAAQPNATIENMAALMLSLLLSKSDDKKDKDDPWKMLAGMALLGAMANQNQGAQMMQSTTVVSEAYSSGGAAAASTGATVNIQG